MKKITGYARWHRRNPTPAEKQLRKHLLEWKISFRAQRQFDFFIVDFLIRDRRLAIELDGSSHIGKEKYDKRRTLYLQKLGLDIIRFDNQVVFNNPEVIKAEILKYPMVDISKYTFRELSGVAKY